MFDTFPWPQSPTRKQVDAVAKTAREARRVRAEAMSKVTGGLRAVYRMLELPGKSQLKDAHAALDAAVIDAFGFSAKKDVLAHLLSLSHTVAALIEKGESVTGDGSALVTGDCVEPRGPRARGATE